MEDSQIPLKIIANGQSKQANRQLSTFRDVTVKEHSQLLTSEVERLKQTNHKLDQIYNQVEKNIKNTQATLLILEKEVVQVNNKISKEVAQGHDAKNEEYFQKNIVSLNQRYVETIKKRVKIANEINIANIKKIDIEDKKSIANDIFKWVLAVVYNEPDNKYFWPNFKEQAILQDKGVDFKQRLGKVGSSNANEGQRIKTEHFLQKYDEIARAPELKKHQEQANSIKEIALLFREGYKIHAEIKENEVFIQKYREGAMEKEEQVNRWRARVQALNDRIQINKKCLATFGKLKEKLGSKAEEYKKYIVNGEKALDDFQKLEKWSPTINLSTDPKGNCQCTLF